MELERLSDLFADYDLDPGGMIHIVDEMVPMLERLGFQRGLKLADRASDGLEKALEKEYGWKQQQQSDHLRRQGAAELDNKIDKTLSNLLQGLETYAQFPEGSDKREVAEELIGEFFGNGVYPITSQTFMSQQAHVAQLVDKFQNDYEDEFELLGFAELVDKLGEMNEEFGSLLRNEDAIQYDEVRAARTDAQDAFYEFLVAVIGEYGRDMETLKQLLDPYLQVNERIRRHARRSGGETPPIDPDSGEPVDPDGGGGAPTDGGSPSEGDSPNNGETRPDGDGTSENETPNDGQPPTDDGTSDGDGTPDDERNDG